MSSLADRLKALGVQLGAEGFPRTERKTRHPIETVVEGRIQETPGGETFVVEKRYAGDHRHGQVELRLSSPLEVVAAWAGDERIAASSEGSFAFLDTETTGLAGGTGTYAFLVGVGRFDEQGFQLAQFFMRDPLEEPALLAALESFLAPCETLVTFNGKAFDLPLLEARYISHGAPPPLASAAHLDLLHLARRLWRQRLPSRALGYLEEHILGQRRAEEDVPGWLIPQMYFDYLRSGDARPLRGVFYHNAMDVLALAALMNRMAGMLAEPLEGAVEHPSDLVAVGRLYEDMGQWDHAARIMERGLDGELPAEQRARARQRLATLHRRRGELDLALKLWRQAAEEGEVYAHVEIAKYYEHRIGDFAEALRWTQAAIERVTADEAPRLERFHWLPELEHRQARLLRRLARRAEEESGES